MHDSFEIQNNEFDDSNNSTGIQATTIADLILTLTECGYTDDMVCEMSRELRIYYLGLEMTGLDEAENRPDMSLKSDDAEQLLGTYTRNLLLRKGYDHLYQFTRMTRDEVRSIDMIGKKRVAKLEELMAEFGLSFASE